MDKGTASFLTTMAETAGFSGVMLSDLFFCFT
jgi:hypothetical protein